MNNLLKVLESLKKNRVEGINYTVPSLWFLENYSINHKVLPTNEVMVNPYDFYSAVIEEYVLKNKKDGIDYSSSLSKSLNIKSSNGEWIKKSILYSSIIRTSSAWDSDRSYSLDISNINGLKETGTFVKTIALLPLLKRLGVNVLYLLPISKYSLKDKKGDLGSPYSVESFTELDPLLKDTMTGNDLTIDEEFSALVEACHIMGIRVTIDIIPRTNSVCSSLIRNNPEWFYWIKASEIDKYKVPYVDTLGKLIFPSIDVMDKVYETEDVIRHIKMFEKDPKTINIDKWNSIKGDTMEEFLDNVEKEFDLKIAPAFSDNINDPQPAWSDITFLRMYLDDPVETRKYLNIEHNPYILFDTIKSNLFPGEIPNTELWNMLSNIIPSYQKRFGIDGARIDMGHALPKELLSLIMSKAKEIDDDFSFIAEELNMACDKSAKEKGYNAMIGNSFWALPRVTEGFFKSFINNLPSLAIPALAAGETHDTRRITKRYGGKKFTRFLTILDYFLPNSIPFINSGQEVYEVEPINTGLDSDSSDLESLDINDPYYSKLALFDKYQFHYTNDDNMEIINHLVDVLKVRDKWIDKMVDLSNYNELHFYNDNNYLVGLSYINKETNKALIIIGNGNMDDGYNITLSLNELRNTINNHSTHMYLKYATYEMPRDVYEFNENEDLYCYLGSGEVKIYEL